MASSKRDNGRKALFAIVVVLLIAVIAAIAFGLGGDEEEGQGEEGGWSDLNGFRRTASGIDGITLTEAGSPTDLNGISDASRTLYFLMGIEEALTSEEIAAISGFVGRGGKVVVADDGTLGNELGSLPSQGSDDKARFEGHRYLVQAMTGDDDTGYIFNRSFVRSYGNIDGWNFEVVAHDPMGMNVSGQGEVWLRTTKRLTVIDLNDNYVQELSDKYTPFGPICASYTVGDRGATISYFSTTGIFTDNVFHLEDNEGFSRSFIRTMLPEGGDLLLDRSKEAYERSPHRSVLPEG